MKTIDVTITYLRQTRRPNRRAPHPPAHGAALLRVRRPPLHFYRYLYRLVGDQFHWVSRRRLDDDQLAAIIHDDDVHVYVLFIDGAPAGFCELDHRVSDVVEVKFFGLAPERIGQGWGAYFLWHCLDIAWSLGPGEVRLETCTLDHPAALPLYQKYGFEAVDMRRGKIETIDD